MKRHLQYAKYVLRHKWFVFKACLQLGVPLWIAIFHDWDKFAFDEWFPYARTFYTPDGKKQYVESVDFARAWMKHQHRNKHHWQYYCYVNDVRVPVSNMLIWDRGTAQEVVEFYRIGQFLDYRLKDVPDAVITADPMPDVYRREMLADWRGAGLALGFPDTTGWYAKNKDKMILHPDTRAWIEQELGVATP
jgi:hypothetical protein